MKKLCALLLLCLATTIQADQLTDAIAKSDLEQVQLLLAKTKPTGKQLVKYLDAAEQAIRMRRDNLASGNSDLESLSPDHVFYARMSLGSDVMYLASAIMFVKYIMTLNQQGMWVCGTSMGISVISSIAYYAAMIRAAFKRSNELYSNAVAIKGMLYEGSDSVS